MLRAQFVEAFNLALDAISQSENVTRRELRDVSRTLLVAIHGFEDATLQGDIQFINRLLTVLTPVNRKVAVLFFTHFAGFHYDDKVGVFTKKSAKRGIPARKDAQEFLADPNNNIWSWAERHVEVEAKPFELKKVTKFIESALKKAADQNMTHADVLRAVFAAGVSADALVIVMDELAAADAEKKERAAAGVAPL